MPRNRDDLVPALSRRGIARLCVLGLVIALLVPSAVSAVTYEPVELERGAIDEPADGNTVIAVQGFKLSGQDSEKKPARLVGVGPEGDLDWHQRAGGDLTWFYDVDPLENGNLLVVATNVDGTVVFEYDPEGGDRVWTERFDLHDTHDVDKLSDDELLIANMRNYNESADRNDDRLLVYNRTQGEVTWEWHFRNEYDRDDGGDYTGDWTHVNDVDVVGENRYMASVRNMDEVIVVNRTSGEVDLRLGQDGNHSVVYEQHNPHYFETDDGTPVILVADSENDRVVEYQLEERRNGTDAEWNRTWTLGAEGNLNWPRDADRLPNGNTLVTDTLNHRVIEVTPQGEVVWEYYAPWGTYESERVQIGSEPGGPAATEMNATGAHAVTGSAALTPGADDRPTFAEWLSDVFAGTPISGQIDWFADRWAHATPWIRPRWMSPWDFVGAVAAGLLLVGWAGTETVTHRSRIRRRLARLRPGADGGGDDPSPDDD